MAKTFVSSLPSVSTGSTWTATAANNLLTTMNSHTVPPLIRVRRAAAQTISVNTAQAVYWDTQDINTDGTSAFTASSNIVTIQTTGVYLVSATLNYPAASGSGPYGVAIYANPTIASPGTSATITAGTRITGTLANLSSGSTQTVVTCSTIYSFNANDTIAVLAYQNSVAGVALSTTNEQNTLSIAFMGRVS
jgi:hypothetical protein